MSSNTSKIYDEYVSYTLSRLLFNGTSALYGLFVARTVETKQINMCKNYLSLVSRRWTKCIPPTVLGYSPYFAEWDTALHCRHTLVVQWCTWTTNWYTTWHRERCGTAGKPIVATGCRTRSVCDNHPCNEPQLDLMHLSVQRSASWTKRWRIEELALFSSQIPSSIYL